MKLTASQEAFVQSQATFPAFVGGFGSGKTACAIARTLFLKRLCLGCDVAYYLPTYGLVEDIAYQRIPALLELQQVRHSLNKQTASIVFGKGLGRLIFRTMDNPSRIVGYEVAHSVLDELDTLPTDKAREVWNKVIARNRQKAITNKGRQIRNTVAVATTPEGFRFVYDRWVKNKARGYEIYKAKTTENAENLPPDYIPNLQASYPSNLLAAYLDGEFVNLTSGSVYPEFDRYLNGSRETMTDTEPLHIGMDFNVEHMAAVVFVMRDGKPHAVDEVIDAFDTPAMIRILQGRYPSRQIFVYPDASGKNRKSVGASESDLALLRQARFVVLVNSTNPLVKDRVLSTNRMIHADGVRSLFVNADKCPAFVEALEKQAYDKNGEPDKSAGLDHVIDSGTYFIAYKFPIQSRRTSSVNISMR
jgi:hypothetical protein